LNNTRTRLAIRQAAMSLFHEHGYEATTVEQIAAYAKVSMATFHRYYSDKEDVVLNPRDSEDLVEKVLAYRPERESVFDTFAVLFARRAEQIETDREAFLMWLRLISDVPALQGRRLASWHVQADLLASHLALRARTSADDHGLRLAITIALAAESETLYHWARIGGTESLTSLLSDALAKIEPVLSTWSGRPALDRLV
jgi:AcrR family transcriptional regulator